MAQKGSIRSMDTQNNLTISEDKHYGVTTVNRPKNKPISSNLVSNVTPDSADHVDCASAFPERKDSADVYRQITNELNARFTLSNSQGDADVNGSSARLLTQEKKSNSLFETHSCTASEDINETNTPRAASPLNKPQTLQVDQKRKASSIKKRFNNLTRNFRRQPTKNKRSESESYGVRQHHLSPSLMRRARSVDDHGPLQELSCQPGNTSLLNRRSRSVENLLESNDGYEWLPFPKQQESGQEIPPRPVDYEGFNIEKFEAFKFDDHDSGKNKKWSREHEARGVSDSIDRLNLNDDDEYETFDFDVKREGKDAHLSIKDKRLPQEDDEAYECVNHIDSLASPSDDVNKHSPFDPASFEINENQDIRELSVEASKFSPTSDSRSSTPQLSKRSVLGEELRNVWEDGDNDSKSEGSIPGISPVHRSLSEGAIQADTTPISIGDLDDNAHLVENTNFRKQHITHGDYYRGNITINQITGHAQPDTQLCQGPHKNCHLQDRDINDNMKEGPRTVLDAQSYLPYKELCFDIIKQLDQKQDKMKRLVYYVSVDYDSGCGIPRETKIDSAETLISELEKCHLLGPRNILFLQKLLYDIGEKGLVSKIEQYVRETNDDPLYQQNPKRSKIASITTPVEIILEGNPQDYNLKHVDELRQFISKMGIPRHTITLVGIGNGSVILIFQVPKKWKSGTNKVMDVTTLVHSYLWDNCDWLVQHRVTGFHVAGFECSHLTRSEVDKNGGSQPEYKRTSSPIVSDVIQDSLKYGGTNQDNNRYTKGSHNNGNTSDRTGNTRQVLPPLNKAKTLPLGRSPLKDKSTGKSIKNRLNNLTRSFRRLPRSPKDTSRTKEFNSDSESYGRSKIQPSPLLKRRSRSVENLLDLNDGYDQVQYPELPRREPPKSAGLIIEGGDEYETFNYDIPQGGSHDHLAEKNKRWSQEDEAYESVEHVDGLPIASEDERRYSRFELWSMPVDGSDGRRLPSSTVPTKPPLTSRSTADEKPIPAPRQSVRQKQLPSPQPPPAKEPILPAPSAEENCQMAHQAIQNVMNANPEARKTDIVIQTLNFVAKFCDAHGGYLEVGSKKATLFIPPFALDSDTLIYVQIEESYCLLGDQGHQIAPVVHCGEPGTQFNTPVILTFCTSIQDTRYFNVTGLRKQTPKAGPNDNEGKRATTGVRKKAVQSANEDPAKWHATTEKEGKVMSIENGKCTVMLNHLADDSLCATPKEKHFAKIDVVAFTSPVMKKGNIFDIRVWMSSNQEVLKEDERREMKDNQGRPLYHFCPTLCLFEDGGDVTVEITNLEKRWSIYPNSSPREQSVKLPKLRYMYDHDDQGIRESLVFRIHPIGQFVPREMVSFDIDIFQPDRKDYGIHIPVCVEPEPETIPDDWPTGAHGQNVQCQVTHQPGPWMPPKERLERLEQNLSRNDNWKPLAAWLHLDVCNLEGFPNPATTMLSMVYQNHALNGGERIRNALEELDKALSTGKLGAGLREAGDIVKEILGKDPAAQPAGSVVIREPTAEVWPVSMSPIEVNEYRFNYRTLQSDPYASASVRGPTEEQLRRKSSGYCTIPVINPNRPPLKTPETPEFHYDQPYVGQTGLAQANAVVNHLGDSSYDEVKAFDFPLCPSDHRSSDGLLDVDMSEGRRLSDVIREQRQDPPYQNLMAGTKPKGTGYLKKIPNSKVLHK